MENYESFTFPEINPEKSTYQDVMINDNWEQDCIKENEELWTCLNIDKDNDTHQTSIQLNEQNTDHETEEGEVNDTDSEVDETEFSELN
jgi:hypothetical protein